MSRERAGGPGASAQAPRGEGGRPLQDANGQSPAARGKKSSLLASGAAEKALPDQRVARAAHTAYRAPSSELIRPSVPPTPLSKLVPSVVDAASSERMSQQRRAWVAWRRANGDRERAHTVYVTLRRPRRASQAPVLVVGVDSHSFASDLSANKEIYLSRMANVGIELSALEVRVAQRRTPRPAPTAAPARTRPLDLADLTPEERAYVERMVAGLPDSIRPSASKALGKSILRKRQL